MKTVIYHNARCSKSRATLALLQERGIEPQVINYLENPPGADELESLLALLDLPPTALVRFNEPRAKELALRAQDPRTSAQWCEVLAANPILIERPIVVQGGRAAIGRPPEKILPILI